MSPLLYLLHLALFYFQAPPQDRQTASSLLRQCDRLSSKKQPRHARRCQKKPQCYCCTCLGQPNAGQEKGRELADLALGSSTLQGSFVGMASTVFTLSEHAATQAFFTQVMALSLEHAPKTPLPFLPHCSTHGTGQSLKARSARCGKVGHVQNYETRRPK